MNEINDISFETVAVQKRPYNPRERGRIDQDFVDNQLAVILNENQEYHGGAFYNRDKGDPEKTLNGGYLWNQMALHPLYKKLVTDAEITLFQQYKEKIEQYILSGNNDCILDIGVGGWGKFFALLDGYSINQKRYTALDLSPFFLEKAIEVARKFEKETKQTIPTLKLHEDRKNPNVYKANRGATLRSGGSMGNNQDHENTDIFKAMSAGGRRNVLITHFLSPQGDDRDEKIKEIEAAYNTPEMEEWTLTGFTALGVPRDALTFTARYEEGIDGATDMMKIGAVLTTDLTLIIHGKPTTKKAGTFLQAINSRRYTKEQVTELAQTADCTIKDSFDNDTLAVTVLQTPKQPLRQRRKELDSRIKNSIYGLLIAGSAFGTAYKVATDSAQEKFATHIEQIKNKSLMAWQPSSWDPDRLFTLAELDKEQQTFYEDIIATLEQRYGNDLSQGHKFQIGWMLTDYPKTHRVKTHTRSYGGMRTYSLYLLGSHDIEEFVRSHKTLLEGIGINTVPNKHLVDQTEALINTYTYTGEPLHFSSVDKELEPQKSFVGGKTSTGEPLVFERKAGIKYIEGKPYLLFQNMRDTYSLEPFVHNPYSLTYTGNEYLFDVIKQGEITLLAEQIVQFLNEKYGEGDMYATNGTHEIVRYLTSLYGQGYNLSYLMGNKYSTILHEKPQLDIFVREYVVPSIAEQLQTGTFRMHDVDFCEITEDKESIHLPELVNSVSSFIHQYTQQQSIGHGKQLESLILELMFTEKAREFLANEWDIRCWITEHADDFERLNLTLDSEIPDLDKYDKRAREKTMSSEQYSVDESLSKYMIETYTLLDGRKIIMAGGGGILDVHAVCGRFRLNAEDRQFIHHEFIKNNGNGFGHGTGLQLIDGVPIDKAEGDFTSAVAALAYQDYLQRKQAREDYQAKKKR